jgi:hypothetical protein
MNIRASILSAWLLSAWLLAACILAVPTSVAAMAGQADGMPSSPVTIAMIETAYAPDQPLLKYRGEVNLAVAIRGVLAAANSASQQRAESPADQNRAGDCRRRNSGAFDVSHRANGDCAVRNFTAPRSGSPRARR